MTKVPFTGTITGEIDIDLPDLPEPPPSWPPVDPPTEPPVDPTPPPGDGTNLERIFYAESFQDVPLFANPKDHTSISDTVSIALPYGAFEDVPQGPGGDRYMQTFVSDGGNDYGGGDFGKWGFILKGDDWPTMGEGGEVWIRCWCFYGEDFSWMNQKHVKHWRIHKKNSSGGNNGYIDTYIHGSGDNELKSITEMDEDHPDNRWFMHGLTLPKGRWHCFEEYVKFDRNNGKRRMWLDGSLIASYSHGLSDRSGCKMDQFNLHTYWDQVQPKLFQWMCYTHLAVAAHGFTTNRGPVDDRPYLVEDAWGNKMIGTGV